MAYGVIDHETLTMTFTHMEAGEGEAKGWGKEPTLFILTSDQTCIPHSLTIHEVVLWEWTAPFPVVLAAPGANGDIDHDLDLYATNACPRPGFLAVALMYEDKDSDEDADPDGIPARRYLTAVTDDGTVYQVTRYRGEDDNTTETLPSPEQDAFGPALARIAAALRG